MGVKDVLNSKDFVEQFKTPETGKVGVLFSSFDCMDAGHMLMLKDATSQCDYLVVGLQTDPTIDEKYRKGTKEAPIMSLEERYEMILGCKYIDNIFIYETEKELHDFLKNFKWDVRILDSKWKGKKYTGRDLKTGVVYFHKIDSDFTPGNMIELIFERELAKRKVVS